MGYTTYNQRRYYKRKYNLVIGGVKEDLIKVKGVFCWQNERNLQAFNIVSSLIVMNEILHFVIINIVLGNHMTFMERPRPSGPWNEHRSSATEHVLSDFENLIYTDLWFKLYIILCIYYEEINIFDKFSSSFLQI